MTSLADEILNACEIARRDERENVINKACKSFCNRCVHNQTLKNCMYLDEDCPLLGAFRKDLRNRL